MLVGYVRVSTSDDRQSTDLQQDALLSAGVDQRNIHEDRASGARHDRPGLRACLGLLRPGDILVDPRDRRCGLIPTAKRLSEICLYGYYKESALAA
jgi:DNA invertase Pin-like site-specific DNA recombinase